MKKVLFALKDMNVGGVEKSLLSLLQSLDRNEYRVDILLLRKTGGFLEALPDWVNLFVVDEYETIEDELNKPPLHVIKQHLMGKRAGRAFKLFWGYVLWKLTGNQAHYYRCVISDFQKMPQRYDVAVSYTSLITYLTWYVKHFIQADSYVGWVHFDVAKLVLDKRFVFQLHKDMDRIYVVSEESKDSFVRDYPQLASKCQVRYNIVDANEIMMLSDEPAPCISKEGRKTIVTLGRLSSEKGQDIIPDVARLLAEKGVAFCWYLIGDGNLRNAIEKKVREYHLEGKVVLLGTLTNPYPYLKQADIYVQTSVHEGFCITLGEAKVFGMPIVSTEFSGAHEQLDTIANAKIVCRNPRELYLAICSILKL